MDSANTPFTTTKNAANTKSNDYAMQIYDSLPENAKQYYYHKAESDNEWSYRLSFSQKLWRDFNLIRIYPLTRLVYCNSNEVVCCVVSGEHRIYQGPGFHWVVGVNDRMESKKLIGQDIDFGPIKIIYVRPGLLKFAQFRDTGKPLLLGPGMHYFKDLYLEIGNEINMNFHGDNQTVNCDQNGAFQFVFVRTGSEAVIISRNGELKTLGPGLHFIQAPDALKSFVSVQQEYIKISSVSSNQKFLTADNVELHITATIFYRIVDVKTMFTTRIKDHKDLEETIHSQATATLLTIIRSENFQGIGKTKHMNSLKSTIRSTGIGDTMDDGVDVTPSAPLAIAQPVSDPMTPLSKLSNSMDGVTMGFQNIIQDAEPQFKRMMQSNFSPSGIEIQSLRIEQIEFADSKMQQQISQFALQFTKLSSQQQQISAQRAIEVAEAEREAATLNIKTRAEAQKIMTLKDNENQIKISSAKAEAENKLILADAEAKAKIKIGEAEIYIQEKQNSMPNAQLRIMAEAQVQALQGIQKVVYTDQQSMLLKPYFNMPDFGAPTR